MSHARRRFLKAGAACLAAAALTEIPLVALAQEGPEDELFQTTTDFSKLTEGVFQKVIGNAFQVSVGGRPIVLELIEVARFEAKTPDRLPQTPTRECFSLTFLQTVGPVLESGTYRMAHPDLGAFDLCISLTRRFKRPGTFYEAVINRL